MLKSVITVIISTLVFNIAAYNIRFPSNQQVFDQHWPHDHHLPYNHHLARYHNIPHDNHQPHNWGFPEYFGDVHHADNYDNGIYYYWPKKNSWNGNGWSPNQEIKTSSSRPATAPNPQPQPQPDFKIQNQCIRSCPTTPEYNPVCGTNYLTYDNIGKLECARHCGVDVTLLRKSICPPTPLQNVPTPSSPTTSTTGVPPELSFDVRIKEIK